MGRDEKNYQSLIRFGLSPKQAQTYQKSIDKTQLYRILYRFETIPMSLEVPRAYKEDLLESLNQQAANKAVLS
ncbi:MAG: hypothetical protein AAGE93_22280, partial [Bacteroidota bacterium]